MASRPRLSCMQQARHRRQGHTRDLRPTSYQKLVRRCSTGRRIEPAQLGVWLGDVCCQRRASGRHGTSRARETALRAGQPQQAALTLREAGGVPGAKDWGTPVPGETRVTRQARPPVLSDRQLSRISLADVRSPGNGTLRCGLVSGHKLLCPGRTADRKGSPTPEDLVSPECGG